ncbi:MAG: mechanosensitive ion channel, partial [Planctomycetes bacterium]|nr:mechanosensitive ion channel [Planctomycetota bacterium]
MNNGQIAGLLLNLEQRLIAMGISETLAALIATSVGLLGILVVAWIANWVAKRLIIRVLHHVADRSKTHWDDVLVKHHVFVRMSHLAPALVIYRLAAVFFSSETGAWSGALQTGAKFYMALMGWFVVSAFLNAVVEIYGTFSFARRIPIRSFIQVAKTLLAIATGILVLSWLLDKDPSKLLAGMGAMTAILILVFKDSILGLVAGIQLSANRMVRIGDWIEMPKYGADGDVTDISLTTIKVQNWDKTISTIPAYALISDSFKNWRGMEESGGRRIKRNLYIDMNSISLCDQAMVDRFKKFQHITQYIEGKQDEIERHNSSEHIDTTEVINSRRLTNIGTFRAYVEAYL